MRTFDVYRHPVRGFKAVKQGWSWPACFFGVIWMLVNRLWGLTVLWFAFYVGLSIFETATDQAVGDEGAQAASYLVPFIAYLALWLVPAIKGNQWRANNLVTREYEKRATVEAASPNAAVAMAATEGAEPTPP